MLTGKKILVFIAVLIILVSLILIYNSQKFMAVGGLFDAVGNSEIRISLFSGGSVPEKTVIVSEKQLICEIKNIIAGGSPEWKWSGYRPNLSQELFRVEIVTSVCSVKIALSGLIYIIDKNESGRSAETSRSAHLYDQIASFVRRNSIISDDKK